MSNPILSGETTARERVDATYQLIEAHDNQINAFVELTPELAYAAADRIDAAVAAGKTDELGPLAGVPVSFKDNMNLIGSKMTCCSKMLADFQSVYTATCVAKMIDAGALPIGKTNLDEFAMGATTESSYFGPTHNPWDLTRVPGGSSGGAAASVAAGMVPIALGSDTGGSIRQPAAFTGTIGLKPTHGRVSRFGVAGFASSLDQVGPVASTVADVARTLNVIAGFDTRDATSAAHPVEDFTAHLDEGVAGLRVAVATDMLELEGLDPQVKSGIADVAAQLEAEGAHLGEVTLSHAGYGLSVYQVLSNAEASSTLARLDGIRYGARVTDATDVLDLYLRTRAEGFGPEVIKRLLIGTYVLAAGQYDRYYDRAMRVRTLIKQDYEAAFADYDIILMPTTLGVAWPIDEQDIDQDARDRGDLLVVGANLSGHAALSQPLGLTEAGLPLGIQVHAAPFAEATLLRCAAAIERLLNLSARPLANPESVG